MSLEWAVATRTRPGETECGDRGTVVERPDGSLIAVADGLGHGPEAAEAAVAAIDTIEANSHETPEEIFRLCHQRLRRTRGVALSLATLHESYGAVRWSGVGNVDGVLLRGEAAPRRGREAILLRGGIVGFNLPSLHVGSCDISAGDIFILSTDGIRSPIYDSVPLHESAQTIADGILHEHFRGTDDALVLVARFTDGDS